MFIPNPFGDQATALLTVERGEVLRYQVLTLEVGGSNVDLPLSGEDAPNVFVAITVIGQTEDGGPDFRQGYLELTVAVVEEHLTVEVTSQPERTGPGDEVTLTMQGQRCKRGAGAGGVLCGGGGRGGAGAGWAKLD